MTDGKSRSNDGAKYPMKSDRMTARPHDRTITADNINLLGYKVFTGNQDFFANGVTGVINTINPHSYIVARKDVEFRKALMSSDFLIPDGVGIKYASLILKKRNIQKIAGSDLHIILLQALNDRKGSCFYLGSSNETLNRLKYRIAAEYPDIRSDGMSPPFRQKFNEEENRVMIDAVNSFSPDVLFVGMTAPKQEKWVYENRHRINARVVCSIGAVFDFYAGTAKRSGQFWINAGLEWLPRLLREPKRLWRRNFVSTPLFIWYVFVEWIKGKRRDVRGE